MLMSGRYLLDTNIVIALFADEAIVKNNLALVIEEFVRCYTLMRKDEEYQLAFQILSNFK
jgi:predicted nucleic acid-binding protein